MSIAELKKVVPPPSEPFEAGPPAKWGIVEEKLNLKLPPDFRELGLTYGTGRFCDGDLQIYNPFSDSYEIILESQLQFLSGVKAAGMEAPHEPHPAKPGLFPLGRDQNGHSLYWITQGKAESWPILLRSHENAYETYKMTLTEFLTRAFSNSIESNIWTESFKAVAKTFKPTKPKPSKTAKPKPGKTTKKKLK